MLVHLLGTHLSLEGTILTGLCLLSSSLFHLFVTAQELIVDPKKPMSHETSRTGPAERQAAEEHEKVS